MLSMDNVPHDGEGSEDGVFAYLQRKTLLSSKDCRTVDDLIHWIADDAQYQSSQYIDETRADCEGE